MSANEEWEIGVMERWSNGVLGRKPTTPILQYSIAPRAANEATND